MGLALVLHRGCDLVMTVTDLPRGSRGLLGPRLARPPGLSLSPGGA
jgi:hypothetical protein